MTDAELHALLDAASPGPWHHVNPGMVSPKTRTIHGTVPAEPIDYVSTWPGLGTPPGHRVVINRDAGVRSADMALIAEAPALAAEVLALRAGAAASAERIKALEGAVRSLIGIIDSNGLMHDPVYPPLGFLKRHDGQPVVDGVKQARRAVNEARALLKESDQ